MNQKQLVAAGVTGFALAASATTYYWKSPVDGAWNTASNWCTDSARTVVSTVVPGCNADDDAVYFPVGAYTVTAATNLRLDSISLQSASKPGNGVILDFGGHTLTSTRTNTSCFCCLNGGGPVPSVRGFARPYTVLEFRNGTVDLGTSYLQMIVVPPTGTVDDRRGCFVVGAGASVTSSHLESFRNASRFFVEKGGKFTCGASAALDNTSVLLASSYPLVCVSNANSVATFQKQLALSTPGAGLYALDHAQVALGDGLAVGTAYDRTPSTNCFVRADNAMIAVTGLLRFGGTGGTAHGAALEIAGTNGQITVDAGTDYGFHCYEDTGSHIDIDIPADGFRDEAGNARVPLSVDGVNSVARASGLENFGATQLRVKARRWARKHPNESITLIELTVKTHWTWTANLAANAKVDVPGATVVSKDGNKVILTAPPLQGVAVIVK